MNIVEVGNLFKNYYQYKVFARGKLLTKALQNVSFKVKEGDFFGVLGKNGAGKSTLLRILTTNLNKTNGKVYIGGFDLDKEQGKIKDSISWMFGVDYEGIGWSSVERNLMLAAYFLGLDKIKAEKRAKELIEFFDLNKVKKLDVWRLSSGMKGKYSLAVAMLKDPKILFLDEPLLGLDVPSQDALREMLKLINKDGVTIFYTDHQLNEMERVCKNVAIVNEGKLVYSGGMEDLKEKYRDTNVLDVKCSSRDINKTLLGMKKKYDFIVDYDLVDSSANLHDLKVYTNIDSREALIKVGNYLYNNDVNIVKLNAGLLDLEDVFKKFLRKDKNIEKADKLRYFSVAREEPLKGHVKLLKDPHHKVRGAACELLYDTNKRAVEDTLKNMLKLSKGMQIESLRVIGDKRSEHIADELKKIKTKDSELRAHIAITLGKLGDLDSVEDLEELLLNDVASKEILLSLNKMNRAVVRALSTKIGKMNGHDRRFVIYHIEKMENKGEIFKLLDIIVDKKKK